MPFKTLSDQEKTELLQLVIKTTNSWRAFATTYMLTCRYFRPNVHNEPKTHHCDYVGAAFGAPSLRLD